MSTAASDLARASAAPVLATGGLRTLDVTTTDGSITLAAGAYEVFNGASAHAVACLGASTASMPPVTGASEVAAAFMVPAGGAAAFALDAETAVHAKLLSGTGTLYFHRKGVL